jgi:phosphatidylglycerophosphatase A
MKFLQIRPLPSNLSPWSASVFIALWLHSGRVRPASGTWGSLAALPAVLAVQHRGGWPASLLFAALCFVAGLWAVPHYINAADHKDPSEVVIDEVVGVALAFASLEHFDGLTIFFGFTAFRLLDALKPGPIGWCDRRLTGAWGVMMDDVVAGILAGFCVYGYQRLIFS